MLGLHQIGVELSPGGTRRQVEHYLTKGIEGTGFKQLRFLRLFFYYIRKHKPKKPSIFMAQVKFSLFLKEDEK
jgi:hypothetical protein